MRRLMALSVLCLVLGGLLAPLAAAGDVPEITVDGVVYSATKVVADGKTVHYETPDVDPDLAFTDRHVWVGHGQENLPCPGGIHWIDNENVLTISNCLPEVTTSTTLPTTTSSSVITTTTTETTVPSSTTSTVPEETTTTTTEPTTTTTQPSTTTTQTTPTTLPRTGPINADLAAAFAALLLGVGTFVVLMVRAAKESKNG